MLTARQLLWLGLTTAGMFAMGGAPARAAFHLWDINEIYSNADGSVQFIELFTSSNSQQFVTGHRIIARSADGSESRTFTFPSNSGSPTRNQHLLIATEGFGDLPGGVTPDFILPAGFLFIPAGTLDFVGADTLTYDSLPTDGVMSLTRRGPEVNSPTNFAGQSGSLIPPPTTRTWFVKADAAGANDGTSWADALTDLQAALGAAVDGDEIWVAVGTYTPAGPGGDRTATFQLRSGVALYGGFAGTETSRDHRDPATNVTILSGDLNRDDADVLEPTELLHEPTRAENSYHVVTASGTDETTLLDGFVITAGNANGTGLNGQGGGMFNEGTPEVARRGFTAERVESSPKLANCTFTQNSCGLAGSGGGLYTSIGSPSLNNCTFIGNAAGDFTNVLGEQQANGGGMAHLEGNAVLTNCMFRGNRAFRSGGGLVYVGNGALTNCTISGNNARTGSGGITFFNSDAKIDNCIIWGNRFGSIGLATLSPSVLVVTSSCIQGGWPGIGNIDVDPLFVDADGPDGIPGTLDDDLRLLPGSPCIDAGDNGAVPADVTTDLDGNPRFVDDPDTPDTGRGLAPIVDMGAYEFVPQIAEPPALVHVMDGLGASTDTFISPLGEDVPFDTVDLDLTADAELVSGGGMTLTSNGRGNHTLTLDTPVPVGECVTLTFDVADPATGAINTITITLCHLPLDVNQDGQVNIQDITAWGAEFNGDRRALLTDTNGDGVVNVMDATSVGDMWFGRPPATQCWCNGTALP